MPEVDLGEGLYRLLQGSRITLEQMLAPAAVLSVVVALMLRSVEDLGLRSFSQQWTTRRWIHTSSSTPYGLDPKIKRLMMPDRAAFSLPPDQLCAQMEGVLQARLSALHAWPVSEAISDDPLFILMKIYSEPQRGASTQQRADSPDTLDLGRRFISDASARALDALQSRLIADGALRAHVVCFFLGFVLFAAFSYAASPGQTQNWSIGLETVRFVAALIFGVLTGVLAPPVAQAIAKLLVGTK